MENKEFVEVFLKGFKYCLLFIKGYSAIIRKSDSEYVIALTLDPFHWKQFSDVSLSDLIKESDVDFYSFVEFMREKGIFPFKIEHGKVALFDLYCLLHSNVPRLIDGGGLHLRSLPEVEKLLVQVRLPNFNAKEEINIIRRNHELSPPYKEIKGGDGEAKFLTLFDIQR